VGAPAYQAGMGLQVREVRQPLAAAGDRKRARDTGPIGLLQVQSEELDKAGMGSSRTWMRKEGRKG
jgi:hypothetical protein